MAPADVSFVKERIFYRIVVISILTQIVDKYFAITDECFVEEQVKLIFKRMYLKNKEDQLYSLETIQNVFFQMVSLCIL